MHSCSMREEKAFRMPTIRLKLKMMLRNQKCSTQRTTHGSSLCNSRRGHVDPPSTDKEDQHCRAAMGREGQQGDFWAVMRTFWILMGVWVTQVATFAKTHQEAHFNSALDRM